MSQFYEWLECRIRRDVTLQLAEIGDGNVRLVFKGLPKQMLEELLQRIVKDRVMTLNVKGKEEPVVVLLLTADERNSPEISSGRCNQGYLVKVRNGTIKRLLVLQPPNEVPIISILTTFTKLGVSDDRLTDARVWTDDPFVRDILSDAAMKRNLVTNNSELPDWFESVIKELALLEHTNNSTDFKWTVIRRLFDQPAPDGGNGNILVAFAAMGLVRPQSDLTSISSKPWKITNEIGEYFEREGFSNGFKELKTCAEQLPQVDYEVNSIIEALEQFEKHVLRVAESAPEFASATLRYYCPYEENNYFEEIPNWWYTLDSSTWRSLLDCKAPPRSCIKIEVTNKVQQNVDCISEDVTDKDVHFEIASTSSSPRPALNVFRRVGRTKFEQIGSIESGNGTVEFHDCEVPPHSRPLTYSFEPSNSVCKVASVKVISLSEFEPGFLAVSRSAGKSTLPRKVKSEDYNLMYESDMELDGQGVHQIDLLAAPDFKITNSVYGYGVSTDEDDDSETVVKPSQIDDVAGKSRWNFDAQTDEECRYEFNYKLLDGEIRRARLILRAGDVEPMGASSEFHRLVLKVSRNTSARINLKASQHVFTLQRWMLKDKLSYNPLLLSPSYRIDRRAPDWSFKPSLTKHPPVYDPRPDPNEITPPSELVNLRFEITTKILGEQQDELCETVQLGKWYKDNVDGFRNLINKYLKHYTDWLKDDYDSAAWFDTVIICTYQPKSEMLQPVPVAILLPPQHPARLGWHVVSQYLLVDALDKGVECPGASVFDPTSLPDSMAFPVVNSQNVTEFVPFVSIPSNSDYWAVLWNIGQLDQISSDEVINLFSDDFGIVLSGLSAGISTAQVNQAIKEVFDVNSGRSRLRIRLMGDSEGKSETDNGIQQWAEDHLGFKDDWMLAARTTIDILDARGDQQYPSEPFVANLVQKTNGAARWFTQRITEDCQADISVITHLKQINPETCQNRDRGAYSATSIGSLTRERVRYRMPKKDVQFIGESRILPTKLDSTIDVNVDELASYVELVDWYFESKMADECSCDGISFAPKMSTLVKGLTSSSYCAVSSTDIDFSVFFQPQYGSYLWDYDLPPYASRAQDNVGFYLMAKHSTEIEKQIERAWSLLGGRDLDREKIKTLLSEISSRGLPSLKVLASGGPAAIGEIGVLAACRIFQGRLIKFDDIPYILPIIFEEGKVMNLLVPVDTFAAQFNDFRRSRDLSSNDNRRPDLLVASIRFNSDDVPTALRLTPIEVKTRTGRMDVKVQREALGQAESFTTFLSRLLQKRNETPIWNLAVSKFLATLFSFGFRIYGENVPEKFTDIFMKRNAAVNQAILRDQIEIDVDKKGRLIAICSGVASQSLDNDGDGFEETILINSTDALEIVDSPSKSSLLQGLVERLGNWDLVQPQIEDGEVIVVKSKSPDVSSKPDFSQRHDGQQPADFSLTGTYKHPSNFTEDKADEHSHQTIPDSSGNELEDPLGIHIEVGMTVDTFQEERRMFFPGNTKLTQLNVGIVGNLGTGKTQLTKSIVYQVVRSQQSNFNRKPFFLIFDYKKDYTDPEFTEALGVKVIKPRKMPINIFDTSTVISESPAWLERSNFLFDVLEKIFSGLGPVQKEHLKESVKRAYNASKLSNRSDPILADVFAEYRQVVNKPDAVYSILSDMVDLELFEDDTKKIQPFADYLDGVVVVDLAALGQNDNAKNILVVLFLNLFYENMLNLVKHPFIGSDPQLRTINGFLLVDEADNIMRYQFPVLEKVLLQGREFGVGVLLASQYLSHFKPDAHTNYKEPLLTWFIHQIPEVTVNELKSIGLTEVDVSTTSRIKKLDPHECLYKSLDVDGEIIRGTPYYVLRACDDNTST